MSKIEQAKAYAGHDLESIFFRPMLSGPDAQKLGIRILYNHPMPTTLHFWQRSGDILKKLDQSGWGNPAKPLRYQKNIDLKPVKAEMSFAASDYFNMVWEKLAGSSEINFGDLSGTQLEEAETALFKTALAESIRMTMWYGDTGRPDTLNTFDGILKRLVADMADGEAEIETNFYLSDLADYDTPDGIEKLLRKVWDDAPEALRYSKSSGELVYLVTSDLYTRYEDYLNTSTHEIAYLARQNGRDKVAFNGIELVDVQVGSDLPADLPRSFILLTDRRNLAMAVNTTDFPGSEVRMWYNPDQMENRQRAVFLAGCDYLLPEMISLAVATPNLTIAPFTSATGGPISVTLEDNAQMVAKIKAQYLNSSGAKVGAQVVLSTTDNLTYTGAVTTSSAESLLVTLCYVNDMEQEMTLKRS